MGRHKRPKLSEEPLVERDPGFARETIVHILDREDELTQRIRKTLEEEGFSPEQNARILGLIIRTYLAAQFTSRFTTGKYYKQVMGEGYNPQSFLEQLAEIAERYAGTTELLDYADSIQFTPIRIN